MKFKKIFSLIILISCLNVKNNEDNTEIMFESVYSHLEKEINNFGVLNKFTLQYMNELNNQNDYVKFIENMNKNYYYPLQKVKTSLNLEHISLFNLINNSNCISSYLLIGEQRISLLCINNLYNYLSLYNLSSKEGINETKIFQIPIELNLNYSGSIKISFSSFDEEETKILIFNNEKIYSIHIKLNYSLDSFKISYINNFTVANFSNNNLIYTSTALYHGNRYVLYGYKYGECKIFLLKENNNENYLSIRTIFNLNDNIYKIYQIQGYLFIIYENRKKIRILSLLGSNSILLNCYSFNEIIDIAFDYKNNFLYILDNKGTIIIKELSLSVSKAYTNTCNNIYSLQIPNYIVDSHKNSKEILKLIMTKNTNLIYILGYNYLGYINDKYELENYILYHQNKEHINDNNNIIFSKGNINYLITNYQDEAIIYKIKPIKKEKKSEDKKKDKKEKTIYKIISDNSRIVECNGNLICKLLFNSFTNNKYVVNTLYLTCLVIIISTVYYFKNNSFKNTKYKSFKEDDLDNKDKEPKFSKMFEKMKNIKNFEMFSDYKKRQRENNNKKEEDYKDYYGDEDDNDINEEEKEENEEKFLEKAYRDYVNKMMKKKIGDNEENEEEDDYEDDEIEDNFNDNENDRNQFEERKGHSDND